MAKWEVDAREFEELVDAMEQYGVGSGQIVDDVLHHEGAQEIKDRIAPLIPISGRKWKKKGKGARSVMPGAFKQDNFSLSVDIAARGKWHYLYFPDDGSNTLRHAGNQQFMRRGAEAAAEKVIELCVGKLTEGMN